MEIPLNYYRILGVPIQANHELLTQAYGDRCLQLPHRDYSQYAIISRKNLLDQAFEVLSDSQKNKEYNQQFLASNDSEAETPVVTAPEGQIPQAESAKGNKTVIAQAYTPSLDLREDLFMGALLILQELGEYELVLKLAQPYFDGQKQLDMEEENTEKIQATWNDLVLILTLSYFELGREQWQLGEYELAFQSQEKALNLLIQENLFPSLQEEINNDLHKLKPYLIVEILKHENQDSTKRQKAIKMLKDILNERGGIEGRGIDKTGLKLDDFLLFIQQIRVYLTITEQQELFEAEAQRPSPSASYLSVYALIARGFLERNPAFMVRAKNILNCLTQRQDVYLEQAICALLLGQTEQAEFALSQSQERETIDYIKRHSQGSVDLLPGLCLYAEKWLQNEVFSQFRNLNGQTSSLKEYFADPQVQSYLEHLYIHPNGEINDSSEQKEHGDEKFTNFQGWEEGEKIFNNEEKIDFLNLKEHYNGDEPLSLDSNLLTLVEAERESNSSENEDLVSFSSFLNSNLDLEKYRHTHHNPLAKEDNPYSLGNVNKQKGKIDVRKKILLKNKTILKLSSNKKLLWLIIILLLGSGLAILMSKLGLNRQAEGLVLSISEPLVEIPENTTVHNPPVAGEILDNQTALEIVQNWLSAKEKATGPQYQINEFDRVLSEPLLSRWRQNAKSLENNNVYRRYKHTMAIESVKTNPLDPKQAIIIANVQEIAEYYQQGDLKPRQSYQDKLKVKYDMIKQNNQWLIKDIKVIN